MRKKISVLLLASSLIAITNSQAQKETVLLTVEKEQITVSEFEQVYNKNNVANSNVEQKSVEDYLDLFLNFRLKVKEAERLGLDTVKAYQNELKGYVKQLSRPYLVDKKYTEDLVQEAYDRLSNEVRASHILLMLDEQATEEEKQKVEVRILEIKKQADSGEPFEKLVAQYSEDPSAKENKGDLGYFSAFRMVYPFESAAFKTEVGKVSDPVRTRFGYHLVYVTDKRKALGEVRARHLMLTLPNDATTEERDKVEKKIKELHQELLDGKDFAELARNYSQDPGTARKGGELPWFGSGRMVKEFEEAAFSLSAENEISKPVKTQFGWHIIQLLEKKNIGPFEKEKNKLTKRVERDSRGKGSKESLVKRLKVEYKVREYKDQLGFVTQLLDSTIHKSKFTKPVLKKSKASKVILTIDDQLYGKKKVSFKVGDFVDFIVKSQRGLKQKSFEAIVNKLFDKFVQQKVLNYEESILKLKYPEYKALVKEYRDGILLFELMEDKVWKKAVNDTIGLEAFYNKNKHKHMWGDRLDASIYICKTKEKAEEVSKLINQNKADSVILSKMNQNSELGATIKKGKFQKSDESILSKIKWKVGVSKVVAHDNAFVIVNVHEKLKSQPKELNEARGWFTSEYQNKLEKDWIDSLRKKYSFQINKAAIKLVNQ